MSFFRVLLATSAPTPLSTYTAVNGGLYIVIGLALFAFPRAGELLGAAPLQGQEPGLLSALGVAVAVIGWFYVMGARTRADSFGLATVVDRVLLPFFLVPLWLMGLVDPFLVLPLAILDPLLGLGALGVWLWQRGRGTPNTGG